MCCIFFKCKRVVCMVACRCIKPVSSRPVNNIYIYKSLHSLTKRNLSIFLNKTKAIITCCTYQTDHLATLKQQQQHLAMKSQAKLWSFLADDRPPNKQHTYIRYYSSCIQYRLYLNHFCKIRTVSIIFFMSITSKKAAKGGNNVKLCCRFER